MSGGARDDRDDGADGPARGPALFARIGEPALRAVIADFYDRVLADVMIGFMFAGKDRAHLVEREVELTAKFLGAPGAVYRGLPLRTAHARHTIFGGQFERRLQILKETLADHGVDPEVRRVWIEHTLALRSQVTHDRGSECTDPPPARLAIAPPGAGRGADPAAPIRLGRVGRVGSVGSVDRVDRRGPPAAPAAPGATAAAGDPAAAASPPASSPDPAAPAPSPLPSPPGAPTSTEPTRGDR